MISSAERARRSATAKAALAPQEVRARISAGVKRAFVADPDILLRMSASQKKIWARLAPPERKRRITERTAKLLASLKDPEVIERRNRNIKHAHSQPEWKRRRSAANKERWARLTPKQRTQEVSRINSPAARAKVRERLNDPSVRAKKSASLKKYYAGLTVEQRDRRTAAMREAAKLPEFKERRARAISEALSRPECRAKRSEATREMWDRLTPEQRAQRIAAMREANNRPEVKEKRARTRSSPEFKSRQSASQRQAWERLTPEERARRIALTAERTNRPEANERRIKALQELHNRPDIRAKKSLAMVEACKRPEVKERRLLGRLKAAAALLASRRDPHGKNDEMVDRAIVFRERHCRKHGKKPSWMVTLRGVDPIGFKVMTATERTAASHRLRLAVDYRAKREKRFSLIATSRISQ